METERKFNVYEVDLTGRNLIEASAGTGKTYSIALLVLRLILEKEIPLSKILMVTFTKAAVAELESRIRRFVRLAARYASGKVIDEDPVMKIVDKVTKEKSIVELRKALRNLDELSVMTIHSFCERNLTMYPFETSQSFKFKIATDISEIRDLTVNDYWRRKVNSLDQDLFVHFTEILTRENITEVLNKALDDKEYICSPIDNEAELLDKIKSAIGEKDKSLKALNDHIRDNFESIRSKQLTSFAKDFLEENSSSPADFKKAFMKGCRDLLKKDEKKYLRTSFSDEFSLYEIYYNHKQNLDELSSSYIYNIFKSAIDELKQSVTRFKEKRQLIDFNDQIRFLHKAVHNGLINKLLSDKYRAVFIDEFQDTDKLQYEIFYKLFIGKTVFYIGDPKQSIYGWRKADLGTYKEARKNSIVVPPMDKNFRSTAELIDAINSFFTITENPFADDGIVYENVKPGRKDLGAMTDNGSPVKPFEINGFKKKDLIKQYVVNETSRLIYSGNVMIKGVEVKPSDIAIIVRTNKEARAMKKALSDVDIPAITVDETKVMESDEAQITRYLMEAVIQPNRGAINRILLNRCFGLDVEKILKIEEEEHLENFRALKKTWNEQGIYNMLYQFYDTYNVREHCLEMGLEGQRILTNLYHIAEILHKNAQLNKYTSGELLVWSQRAQKDREEEYEQRIESQDDAVQITTVHRAKGLTYKIVFAPFLDMKIKERDICEFRKDGYYYFTHQPDDDARDLCNSQTEQENRRLIYVALTRAQYKVYLCINKGISGSSVKKLITDCIDYADKVESSIAKNERKDKQEELKFTPRKKPDIEIKKTFGIHSFSALSRAHHSAPFEKVEINEAERRYDKFIYQELERGANVGTALHSIFERLNFGDESTWEKTISDASKYYSNIIHDKDEEKNLESNMGFFRQLADHVMKAAIDINGECFSLAHIDNSKKLPELEFYFSVDKVNRQVVNEYLGEDAKLGGESDMEGLMTGSMDLVFELNGKYFILDWKSNHLGNTTEHYNIKGMEEAMTNSNYHLQYMIYTVALKRWLERRITGFDFDKHFGGVIYVFLRGVREGNNTGIFTKQPDRKQIEELDIALGGRLQQSKN
jgi:exodeoxyribonuclease V beta subunit